MQSVTKLVLSNSVKISLDGFFWESVNKNYLHIDDMRRIENLFKKMIASGLEYTTYDIGLYMEENFPDYPKLKDYFIQVASFAPIFLLNKEW